MRPSRLYRSLASTGAALSLVGLTACGGATDSSASDMATAGAPSIGPGDLQVAADVEVRLAQFAPVAIHADLSDLTETQLAVVDELIAASRPLGEVFLRQAWVGNVALRDALDAYDGRHAAAARAYYAVMRGPWDRLDESNFLGVGGERPPGAGFYPEDLSRAEFEAFVAGLQPAARADFEGLFHVVRRDDAGELVALAYAEVYGPWLEESADHLRAAAELTEDPTLARFLRSRAAAYFSGDYYRSDKDWMDLDGRVEVTIGPYEVYEDRLFGQKAAFESFVTVVSKELGEALAVYKDELPFMERNLPIPAELKNLERGTESPIRVADLVFSAGDARAGVQTIAFNLPNDERVREEKGSKKVILRNVMDAKYREILEPLAQRVLAPRHHQDLRQQAFFDETLFHELSHGLGPGRLVLDGRETEVRLELEEIYSTCEEAKADVMGAYNVLAMIDRGHFADSYREPFLTTYFAGLFRSVRFGIAEAHGRGAAAQISYYLEHGGAELDADSGRFVVDPVKLEELIGRLTREICLLQAAGDKAGTLALFERYGILRDEVARMLGQLGDLPVDIRPVFPAAGESI